MTPCGMMVAVNPVRLGVDFGTSHTVAVISIDGREPRPLLFDGSPLLPSAVCVDLDGRLLVGRDALHTSLARPEWFEPYPKRRIDDGTVLLGETETTVERLVAAVLERVAGEAVRIADAPVTEAVLTCPAGWGGHRRATLLAAAATALPAGTRLVAEPVAAAHRLVELVADRLAVGAVALVYDFGAGTFDASVVRRTAQGFEVLATEGLPDCGGLDIDAALIGYLGTVLGEADGEAEAATADGGPGAVGPDWSRLVDPTTLAERRANRQLWESVRAGKEMLARTAHTIVHIPRLDAEVPLGREQLDQLAAPILDRTVRATRAALRAAGLTVDDLAAVLLTGGASRMPAVATVLHRAFGIVPTSVDHPELVVAEGSLRAVTPTEATPVTVTTPVGVPTPVGVKTAVTPVTETQPAAPVPPVTGPAGGAGESAAVPRSGRWSRRLVAVVGAPLALVLVVATAALVIRYGPGGGGVAEEPGGLRAAPGSSPSASASPSVTPTPTLRPGLDPCLIGTWTRRSSLRTNTIDDRKVQFSGATGVVETFRPDGTATIVFKPKPPGVAVVNGVRWEETADGRATANYRVSSDGRLLFSNPKTSGTVKLIRNGRTNVSNKLTLSLEPEHYNCSGDTLVQVSSFYSVESTRVGAAPTRAAS